MTTSNRDAPADGHPLTQVAALAQDGLELLRQELDLAQQETIEKLTPAVQSGALVVAGGMLAAVGSRYLSDSVVRALATRMPHWLASLIFGTGLTAGGMLLIRRGSNDIKNIDLVPQKTINSLRENKAWLINQIKSRLI